MEPNAVQAILASSTIASIEAIKLFILDLICWLVAPYLLKIDSQAHDWVVIGVQENLVNDRFSRLLLCPFVSMRIRTSFSSVALVKNLVRAGSVVVVVLAPGSAQLLLRLTTLESIFFCITRQIAGILLIYLVCDPLALLRFLQVLVWLDLLAVEHIFSRWYFDKGSVRLQLVEDHVILQVEDNDDIAIWLWFY